MQSKPIGMEPAEYKSLPPPTRADAIVRQAIIDRLVGVGAPPLVVLQGPAGSGKSTTLQQIREVLAAQDWATAWLILDNADNDPQRLKNHLHAMLAHTRRADAQELMPRSVGTGWLEWMLGALRGIPGRVALFFDDFHALQDPTILKLFRALLPRLPGRVKVFIGSRSLPEIALASLVVTGRATVLRAEDLRFSLAESRAFFAQEIGLAMAAEEVEQIYQRTEGWPAGLQLFRLALANPVVRHALDDLAAHGPRELTEYLSENVISMQRPEVQEFLLRTSLLRRLSEPLCDAVMGQAGSRGILQQLEHDGLFLSAVDASGTWFRYHGLFATYLRDSLERAEPGAVRELHGMAARWHLEQGALEEAVYHAIQAEDMSLAVKAFNPWVSRLISAAELATVVHWYERVGLEAVSCRPDLMIKIAWALIFLRRKSELRPLICALKNLCERGTIAQTTYPGVVLSLVNVFEDDLPGAARLLGNLPEIHDPEVSGFAAFELGAAANLTALHALGLGDAEAARRLLVIAESHNDRAHAALSEGYTDALDCIGQVLAAQPRQALRILSRTASRGVRSAGTMALAALAASEIWAAYEVDALDDVERLADQFGAQIAHGTCPDFIAIALVSVARTHAARGRRAEADAALNSIDRIAFDSGWGRLVGMVQWERIRLALLDDDLPRARAIVQCLDPALTRKAAGWLPIPELLNGHLLGGVRLALYACEWEEAARRLANMEPLCATRPLLRIKGLILKALLLDLQGQGLAAQRMLLSALALAATGDCVRAFVDEGPHMRRLLERSRHILPASNFGSAGEPADSFFREVLRAAGVEPGGLPAQQYALAQDEPLSKRELHVLRLLSGGASNRDLALQLSVSENTVKFHLKNLYGKLGVGSRAQAIRAAQELGRGQSIALNA